MKIAVVNDIHLGEDLEVSAVTGKTRASSSLGWEKVPKLLQYIEQAHKPDVFMQLGDLIRSSTVKKDIENYKKGLSYFSQLNTSVIHLLGNHEIRKLSLDQIQAIWRDQHIHNNFFGSKEVQGIQIIWLGLKGSTHNGEIYNILPDEQFAWLENELQKSEKPTLIFSHMAWNEQNMSGNYYFETLGKAKAHYWNQHAIQKIIKRNTHVVGIFSAHVHWLYVNKAGDIPFVSLPSMVENIASPEIDTIFPEIFSIIEIKENQKLILTCFSRDFAFFKTEL